MFKIYVFHFQRNRRCILSTYNFLSVSLYNLTARSYNCTMTKRNKYPTASIIDMDIEGKLLDHKASLFLYLNLLLRLRGRIKWAVYAVLCKVAHFYSSFKKLYVLLPFLDSLNNPLFVTLDTISFSFIWWSLKDKFPFGFKGTHKN